MTKKPCRLNASKPHLKTLHHANHAMAGAHIPLVKFNACIRAWAGPSSARQPRDFGNNVIQKEYRGIFGMDFPDRVQFL
jgi:hypothetical protein